MSAPVRTELKAQIKELLYKGQSRRQIAIFLGVTKNTVIGQVTRMKEKGELEGFEDNASRLKTIAAKRTRYAERAAMRAKQEAKRLITPKKVRKLKLVLEAQQPEPIEPSNPNKIGIFLCEAASNSCRFPVGYYDDQHTFCGNPSSNLRKPYCAEHYKIVWVKPSGSKRSLFKRIGFNKHVQITTGG
jgi:hypothetical protein